MANLSLLGFKIDSRSDVFYLRLYGSIADCPALKLISNMVGHTGYYCCFFCFVRGFHDSTVRKRQYPYSLHTPQRTKISFALNGERAEQENRNIFGQLGTCILTPFVDIHLPSCLLVDYAHVTLLRHFRDVIRTVYASLSPAIRQQIDRSLRMQRFPNYFNRKMRGINELAFVKAVEMKNLLFYGLLPNLIDLVSMNQLSFLSLLVLGIRLIHGDKVLGDDTGSTANTLLITYYRDHTKFFKGHLNFVLHLHEHFARLYDDHGPLSSVNTLAYEDFIGYISRNRNGTRFHHDLLAYYYNIDVHMKSNEKHEQERANGNNFWIYDN